MGVPEDVARHQRYVDEFFHAPDIIDVAHRTGHSLASVARIFLAVGPIFEIDWLESQVERMPAATRWQRAAAQAVAGDLVELRRELAERVIGEAGDAPPEAALEGFLAGRGPGPQRPQPHHAGAVGGRRRRRLRPGRRHPPDPKPGGMISPPLFEGRGGSFTGRRPARMTGRGMADRGPVTPNRRRSSLPRGLHLTPTWHGAES